MKHRSPSFFSVSIVSCLSILAASAFAGGGYKGPHDPIINEFVFNHTGTDFNEYVEIKGEANTDYFNIWALHLEGDSDKGVVTAALRFGTSDAHGLVTTRYQFNRFQNGSSTLLLVEGFTGSTGDDLDTDDDGMLDSMPWTRRLDDCVAIDDGGATDVVYCDVVLDAGFDGGIFTVGGASRYPKHHHHGPATAEWVRNDFNAEGIPGFNGSLDPATESLNTPADINRRNYKSGGGAAPAGLKVHDIQGNKHRSRYEGQEVTDVEGVVVAIDNSPSFARGFYMHSLAPDMDPRTSEGIFVLTGSTRPSDLGLSPGTRVEVDGVVEENRPAAVVENLTITRIRSNDTPGDQIEVVGAAGFSPALIGSPGAIPPTQKISKRKGHVEDRGKLKLSQGLDFYESFEGMLVELQTAVAVAPTNRFGELWVVTNAGANATGLNARGGITIRKKDFNPERIQLDDGIDFSATSGVMPGDHLGNVRGVMSYDFENFEVDILEDLMVTPAGLLPETTTLEGGDKHVTVASFNVLNLSPFSSRFGDLGSIIAINLKAPDIIGLQEVQDNNGTTDDGTVSASDTYAALIAAIEAADAGLTGVYDYAQIDPENNQDGGVPGGNIRVGFLYRTDRVSLAPGTPGDATTNTKVFLGPTLSHNPGRILDKHLHDGDAFASSRKPLVAHFVFNGVDLFAIVNHFNSKGGDQPLYGPSQPPELISEPQRLQQAMIVNAFADKILSKDRDARVVILGDLNDFDFSTPVSFLQGYPYVSFPNLARKLPATERYSFIFGGNSQLLDSILYSRQYAGRSQFDIVHTNVEFLGPASDHDPVLARILVKKKKRH